MRFSGCVLGQELENAKLGRFEIIDQIGSGGMGTVYRAFDPRLERRLAIKVLGGSESALAPGTTLRLRELSPELVLAKKRALDLSSAPRTDVLDNDVNRSEEAVDLLAEARAMAQLSHPNVVSVYEIGSTDEQLFIAMELVEGLNLSQWLAKEQRSRADIIAMFKQAAAGLAAAHNAGLIHRDFKPDNVLVSEDGLAQVADFGLAVGQLSREHFVGTRQVVAGTPHFMAPEILEGAAHTPRSDAYAFCVALFEALGGKYEQATRDHAEAAALVKTIGRLPRALRTGLANGLCADPSLRPADGKALEAMLASRTARRVSLVALGVSAVSIGAALAFSMFGAEKPSCDTPWERMDAIWNDDRATEIGGRIAGVIEADFRKRAADVVSALDESAKSLKLKHRDVCEAKERGELSTAAVVSETRCIEERMVKFEALLGVFNRQIKAEDVARLAKLAQPEPSALCASSLPRLEDEALAIRKDWERLAIAEKMGEKTLKVAHAEFLELIGRPAAKLDKRLWAELLYARSIYEARLKLDSRGATLLAAASAARDAKHVSQEMKATIELAKVALKEKRATEAGTLLAMVAPLLSQPELTPALRARFHEQSANVARKNENYELEIREKRLALAEARQVFQTTDELHKLHDRIASNLANALTSRNQLQEAFELRRKLVEIEKERHGPLNHWYLRELALYGELCVKLSRLDEGFNALDKAIAGLSTPENADHVEHLYVAMAYKAKALSTTGRHSEARDLFDEVAKHERFEATARRDGAHQSRMLGDGIDAERRSRAILAATIKKHGETHRDVAQAWLDIGKAALIREDHRAAEQAFAKARSVREEIDGNSDDAAIWLRPYIAELTFKQKRCDEAEPLLRQVLLDAESKAGSDAFRGEVRADHAFCLLELGRLEEAFKAATAADVELVDTAPALRAKARFVLGRAEYVRGDHKKGRELALSARDAFRRGGKDKSTDEVDAWLAKHLQRPL